MKFAIVFLLCAIFTPEYTVSMDVDHSKCTLEYIRGIVMESCIRPMRYRRSKHLDTIIDDDEDIKPEPPRRHKHGLKRSPQLHLIRYDLLPINSTLVIKKKNRRRRRSSTNNDAELEIYFHYCCNHMDICEQIECPW